MKRVLQISLLLNVILLATVGWRRAHEAAMPRVVRGEAQPESARAWGSSSLQGPQRPNAWSFIAGANSQDFIANLRAIGCPETTIRDIVVLQVCREYRNRWLALQTDDARGWDYTKQLSRDHWRDRNEQRSDLRDEMISKLESLFGQSWQSLTTSLSGGPQWGRDPLESFSIETRRQVRDVDRKYRRELEELQQKKWTGDLGATDIARLRELERQKRADLASILSPSELEEYLYRQSSAADYVRRNQPQAKSEAEFRAMVRLALDMEMAEATDALPGGYASRYGLATPDDAKREAEQRKAEFDRRLKELLGEDLIAERRAEQQAREAEAAKAQEARDQERFQQQLITTAAELGVGAEAAKRFFNRMMELKTKFDEMEKNLTGTPQEKQKQLGAAAKAEMEKAAVETMGDKGLAVIERMTKKGD